MLAASDFEMKTATKVNKILTVVGLNYCVWPKIQLYLLLHIIRSNTVIHTTVLYKKNGC